METPRFNPNQELTQHRWFRARPLTPWSEEVGVQKAPKCLDRLLPNYLLCAFPAKLLLLLEQTAHLKKGTRFGRLAPAKCCVLSGMVLVREQYVFGPLPSTAAKHNSLAWKPHLPQASHAGSQVHSNFHVVPQSPCISSKNASTRTVKVSAQCSSATIFFANN